MDYRTLGLKVGLEVHQQLNTGKLFCECESSLSDEHHREILRRLRPTQSEMGEIDRAALEESERRHHFRYQTVPYSCLVEADEEPPHAANREAVEACLEAAALIDMTPVDEVHFMRKIVIDGSNTGGFQRTALVAMDGMIEVGGKSIGLSTLCLEEDAARKITEHGSEVVYRLDRLGIPLVEIATEPVIDSPEEARTVAEHIGMLVRATKKVRRGIGTIREDVNISISGGARIEIKGVQELRLLPLYIEEEVKRQLALLEVKKSLREKGAVKVDAEVKDLSGIFRETKCKVLRSILDADGRILGAKLPKFAGTFGPTSAGVKRLGPEMAAHARVAGVKGLFHSDELPGYGVSVAEVEDVGHLLGVERSDGFVIVASEEKRARAAIAKAVERANASIDGVPAETRDPLPDGQTVYSRPLPGKERMYPETDVPPHMVDEKLFRTLKLNLPELPSEKIARFVKEFDLSREQSEALVKNGFEDEFELLASQFKNPQVVARIYLNTYPELESQGQDPMKLNVDVIKDVLTGLKDGLFAKEAIPQLLYSVLENGHGVSRAIEAIGVERIDLEEVRHICDRVVRERETFIRERGEKSLGPLMGIVMKELRGRVDGQVISEILREKIRFLLK